MDRLDQVKAPPPIPRSPATRRERRRREPEQTVREDRSTGREDADDDPGDKHTIDEYV